MVEPSLDFWIKEFNEGYEKYQGIHLVDTDCLEVLLLLRRLKLTENNKKVEK